jgi:hypothetical protein
VSKLNAERFYSQANEAPQQGDILLGAVARVIADDAFSPARWAMLDEHRATLAPAEQVGPIEVPVLRVAAGRGFVMVCSHDCGLDKEFNAVVDELTDPAGAHPLAEVDAVAQAEGRTDLDRSFTVSPLVRPDKVLVAGEPVDQGSLMGGHIVGYLPVPALVVNGMEIIPESVVDLSYRTTLDRLAYTQRITCVSEAARERLRFALARLDVLRTLNLEIELSAAVGQEIQSAKVSKKNPLIVELVLGDGSKVHLLQTPGSPEPSPRARTSRSVRGGRSS